MAQRKQDPRKAALRRMVGEFMRENDVTIKDGEDLNSIMRELMSTFIEESLKGELDDHLGYDKHNYQEKETSNSRNGYSKKTVHTSYGDSEIDIPRDRDGEFEPQLLPKYATTITKDMEAKIISMYSKGMTTGDIEAHMKELYGVDISDSSISRVTDRILPLVKKWQERPLEEVYAVVYLDAIHYHVRSESRIVKRAVYIAIGIDMSGKKDVLGMYVGDNESAKFWLSILNGLRNRGKVYAAPTEEAALENLEEFGQKWNAKYPKIHKSWAERWTTLSTYFKYPEEVRKIIYTTNTIEGFYRQLRKVTKNRTVFPTDDSLLKLLYLASQDITKNGSAIGTIGTASVPNWTFISRNYWLAGIYKPFQDFKPEGLNAAARRACP